MSRFDCVLIDPTPDTLSQALAKASAAANKGRRARLLHWPTSDFADFVAIWRAQPEGQRQWTGQGASRDTRSAAAVVWWSDPIGRKHCRIVGDRVPCGSMEERDLFQPDGDFSREARDRPFLWHIYPDDLCLRQQGKTWPLWATCRCGAFGPPEMLGWMGPWCAACHDRAEEGAPMARPAACPPVVFSGHPFWVVNLAFALDGQLLLTRVMYEPAVHLWDTTTGQVQTRKFPGQISQALAVSADGRTAAVCGEAGVHLWSLLEADAGIVLPWPLDSPPSHAAALAFSPDGASLAWASGELSYGWLALHDLATGKQRWFVSIDQAEFLSHKRYLAFSPDGRTIALGRRDDSVLLWAVADGRELPGPPGGAGSGSAVTYSPDGKTLAAGDQFWGEDYLRLWDVVTGTVKASLDGPVTDLAFSPDSRVLAVAGRDGSLRLLDSDGRLLETFRWHQAEIHATAFSPDGRWLATCAGEDRVKLWPVEALLRSHLSHTGRQRRKRT